MNLAIHNLLQDRLRFALSVTGVALAVMLMLFLLGLREGMYERASAYLDHAPGSIAVLPEGVKSTSAGSGQFLSSDAVAAVSSVAGVERATPVMLVMAIPELHGRKEVIKLVGYDPALGGGPWDLVKGRGPAADDEVVLDRVLADRHGLTIGGTFELSGRQVTVAGLSGQTASMSGAFVFARMTFVESVALEPGAASLLLVTPAPGISREQLVADLKAVPGTNVLPKSEVVSNDRQILAGILDQVLFIMIGAAFIVGILVVGMVIYTATIERRAEYGILKAIGARNSVLYRVIASQAAVAAGLGALVGVAFAFGTGFLVMSVKPQFPVAIQPGAITVTLVAALAMALLGALVAGRTLATVAPAEVFRR